MGCCPISRNFGFKRIFNRIGCALACFCGKAIVQTSEFCFAKKLTSIYLDSTHRASFGGLDAVYRAFKEEGESEISRKEVQDWLSQQDVYTLHKHARRRYKRSRVIVPSIDAQFHADLCDVQNRYKVVTTRVTKYLLSYVDIFSKYAWAVALKTKQGQEHVKAFQTIFSSGRKPSKVQPGQGTEFLNRVFQKYYETNTLISSPVV